MTLPAEFVSAATEFAARRVVLVATDFDGVLAPLVLDPMQSRALDGTVESLEALAALPHTHAAVVSGRDLATLTALTGLEDSAVIRIGSHGGESSADGATEGLSPTQQATLDALTQDVGHIATDHPGSGVEHKPAAVVLHSRGMDGPAAKAAEEAAASAGSRHTGVQVMRGKHVVEMSVSPADKGTALLALKDAVGATAVAYFGDDVTDEDAFALMGDRDLSVKVGPGDSLARWRLVGPEEVAQALRTLLGARASQS
jgi:trehalose 6-phosphate phosphatase